MSWVTKRIQQYKNGEKATFIEKRCLEHANPVHIVLLSIGAIGIVYGLWMHDYTWIIGGLVLNGLGHIYCWIQK